MENLSHRAYAAHKNLSRLFIASFFSTMTYQRYIYIYISLPYINPKERMRQNLRDLDFKQDYLIGDYE